MFGIRTFTASVFFAALTLSPAATPGFFDLRQGNTWTFQSNSRFGTGGQSIEVQAKEILHDREYLRVNFFGRTVYLRDSEGLISVLNRETGQDSTWLDFRGEAGASFPVEIDPCTQSARLVSKAEKIKTAAGEWDNALQFTFEPRCADAGVTTMYFVPGVGPVVYETTSIAGPVRWELVRARSGSTAAEAPQVAFTVALDAPTYKSGASLQLQVRVTLRNTHEQPVTLVFPSGQRYDLRVWNDRGEAVYSWSSNKLFPQVITREQLVGERTYVFTADLPNAAPGRYVAEAWLATQAREYVGVTGFEVTR